MSHQTGYCCQPPFHAYWAGGEGGRRYARTNDKKGEVPLHENCSSDSGSRTVKGGCSQLTSRQDFSRILRSRHRCVYCMVLLRTAPCLQSTRCSLISNLSGAEESHSLYHQRLPHCGAPRATPPQVNETLKGCSQMSSGLPCTPLTLT